MPPPADRLLSGPARRLAALLACAGLAGCSLEGLADGPAAGGGGGGGADVTVTTVSTGGAGGGQASGGAGTGGGGGEGGAGSAFTWLRSFGNELNQGTSPYVGDAGFGSTLRMSAPLPNGDVWLAAATSGAIDPDGPGGFEPAGNPASRNLFVLRLSADGDLLDFVTYEGTLADVDNSLTVGAIQAYDDGVAIAATFHGGSVDLQGAGVVTQSSPSIDDAFVVWLDPDGVAVAARQLGGANAQTARALFRVGDRLLMAGKLKKVLQVTDPLTGLPDSACTFSQNADVFERVLVAAFDLPTFSCLAIGTLGATDDSAVQQAHSLWADASGVYVAGSFNRQIVAPPLATVPATASEDGFAAAFEPDLGAPVPRWVVRATSNRTSAVDGLRAIRGDGTRLYVGGYLESGNSPVDAEGPSVALVDAIPDNDCLLDGNALKGRDGLVAVLDPATGACLGATLLGSFDGDEVRALSAHPDGVIASGLTTTTIPGLDDALAGGSRDGFFVTLDPSLTIVGGRMIGGLSWDYMDAAHDGTGGVLLAGSFGAPFDQLTGQGDFFVGLLP